MMAAFQHSLCLTRERMIGIQSIRETAVLPKSTKPERMKENADLFSFALSDRDMAAIASMERGDGVAWSIGDPTKQP